VSKPPHFGVAQDRKETAPTNSDTSSLLQAPVVPRFGIIRASLCHIGKPTKTVQNIHITPFAKIADCGCCKARAQYQAHALSAFNLRVDFGLSSHSNPSK
jgi:hypothetical protein